MKKNAILFIVAISLLLFSACDNSNSQNGNFSDDLLAGLNNNQAGNSEQTSDESSENINDEAEASSQSTTTTPAMEQVDVKLSDFAIAGENLRTDIDYSPYNEVINAYGLAYGEMVTPYSTKYTETYDSAGLCYMNLVDLDRNGILELILVAVEEPSTGTLNSEISTGVYADKYYNDVVKIYTIYDFEGEQYLQYLGSTPLSDYEGPVSINLTVEYRPNEFATNLVVTVPTKGWDWDFEFREYYIEEGSYLGYTAVVSEFDQMSGLGDYITEGEEVLSVEIFEEKFGTQGDSIAHYISNQTIQVIDEIRDINTKTVSFLSTYQNSEVYNSIMKYNDGAFVLFEFNQVVYPDQYPAADFFASIVANDIDWLSNTFTHDIAQAVMDSAYEDGSTPGFIVSNIDVAFLENIANFNIGVAEQMEIYYDGRSDLDRMSVLICDVMRVNNALIPTPVDHELKGEKITYFFVVEPQGENGDVWTIDAFFTDVFDKDNENAINVEWITTIHQEFESLDEYRNYIFEETYAYLPDDEAYIAMIGDDLGAKLLLIETYENAAEFYVYENINGARGRLLYDHYDNFSMQGPMVMAVGGDTFPSIEIVCITQTDREYSYVVTFDEEQSELIYNDYSGPIAKFR